MLRLDDTLDDDLPFAHVGRLRFEAQFLADERVHLLALQHQRYLINGMFHVDLFDHAVHRDIAKERNLLAHFFVDWLLRTAHENVRHYADLA